MRSLMAALALAAVVRTAAAQVPTVAVSQNPLRAGTVTLLWPAAGTGPASVAVYSALGTPIQSATLDPDPGKWVWDGTRSDGAPVVNGLYLIVVVRGDGHAMRRRLVVER